MGVDFRLIGAQTYDVRFTMKRGYAEKGGNCTVCGGFYGTGDLVYSYLDGIGSTHVHCWAAYLVSQEYEGR